MTPSEHSSSRSPCRAWTRWSAGIGRLTPSRASSTTERRDGDGRPFGDRAAVDQHLHQSLVAGQAPQSLIAVQIGARVPDVGDQILALGGQRDGGQRGRHPNQLRGIRDHELDHRVGIGYRRSEFLLERMLEPSLIQAGDLEDRQSARDLAGDSPSDPVGNGGQSRRAKTASSLFSRGPTSVTTAGWSINPGTAAHAI